jgi:hypothetical protein
VFPLYDFISIVLSASSTKSSTDHSEATKITKTAVGPEGTSGLRNPEGDVGRDSGLVFCVCESHHIVFIGSIGFMGSIDFIGFIRAMS